MSKDKMDKLEQKKKELEAELDKIQGELDNSLDRMRTDVSDSLDPVGFIKRHPIEVVGASVLIGFLAGHSGSRKGDKSGSSSELGSALWYELKRIATKKGIALAADYLENFLGQAKEEVVPKTNGVKKD